MDHEFAKVIPPEVASELELTGEAMQREILLLAAIKLFELGRISIETAAALTQQTKWDFFKAMERTNYKRASTIPESVINEFLSNQSAPTSEEKD
jgi:predicted HTH domain antitoxin